MKRIEKSTSFYSKHSLMFVVWHVKRKETHRRIIKTDCPLMMEVRKEKHVSLRVFQISPTSLKIFFYYSIRRLIKPIII